MKNKTREILFDKTAELHNGVVHLHKAIPLSCWPDFRHWSVANKFGNPPSSFVPRLEVFGELTRLTKSFIQPRSSATRFITWKMKKKSIKFFSQHRRLNFYLIWNKYWMDNRRFLLNMYYHLYNTESIWLEWFENLLLVLERKTRKWKFRFIFVGFFYLKRSKWWKLIEKKIDASMTWFEIIHYQI